jgi:hypothetical protein
MCGKIFVNLCLTFKFQGRSIFLALHGSLVHPLHGEEERHLVLSTGGGVLSQSTTGLPLLLDRRWGPWQAKPTDVYFGISLVFCLSLFQIIN